MLKKYPVFQLDSFYRISYLSWDVQNGPDGQKSSWGSKLLVEVHEYIEQSSVESYNLCVLVGGSAKQAIKNTIAYLFY